MRLVHPGAAALGARARTGRDRTGRSVRAVARSLDAEEAHVLVPDRRRVRRIRTPKSVSTTLEQARQHLGLGKVLLHLLFGEGVARLAQLLRGVARRPRPAACPARVRARRNSRSSAMSRFARTACALARQVAQEVEHLLRSTRPSSAPARPRRSWRSRAVAPASRRSASIASISGVLSQSGLPNSDGAGRRRRDTCCSRSARSSAYCMTGRYDGACSVNFQPVLPSLSRGSARGLAARRPACRPVRLRRRRTRRRHWWRRAGFRRTLPDRRDSSSWIAGSAASAFAAVPRRRGGNRGSRCRRCALRGAGRRIPGEAVERLVLSNSADSGRVRCSSAILRAAWRCRPRAARRVVHPVQMADHAPGARQALAGRR